MATLLRFADDGTETRVPLFKNLTTLGSDPDSDVVIDGVAPSAAVITHDGTQHTIASADKRVELLVSGRPVRKQLLVDGEDIVIGALGAASSSTSTPSGGTRLRFFVGDGPAASTSMASSSSSSQASGDVASWRRLVAFSKKLGEAREITALLETLMDEVIALTGADKGFLVLVDGAEGPDRADGTDGVRAARVRMARNIKGENLEEAVAHLSDSIVRRVIERGEPVVVSDALTSTEFNSSLSVLSLKLTSVMCVPLVRVGADAAVIGAIYVGNNSIRGQFDEASLEVLTLFAAQASLLVQSALAIDALTVEKDTLKGELEKSRYGELIGACDGMRDVFKKIEKLSRSDVSVLVTGETGTGKELIAREIHKRGGRARGPLVVINCGAIPENLLESELFGHVKGAFTGAVATKPGKFQAANGGTLFLDEIGEMPLHLQVKILRALQERQVQKVGDNKTEAVDIRVVAATHRNLEQMVRDGTFREDLYYRLNVVQLHLPPLRERGEDVVVLASFLLQKYCAEQGIKKIKGFSPRATTAIRRYAWPGNVRQLENRLKRAVVLADGPAVTPEDLDLQTEDLEDILPLADALERFRRRYIDEALERNGGNRAKTARELGVDPRTVFRHLEFARGEGGGDPA
jgi:transcriptional regulator with GAF, ATPase, and Fis domain